MSNSFSSRKPVVKKSDDEQKTQSDERTFTRLDSGFPETPASSVSSSPSEFQFDDLCKIPPPSNEPVEQKYRIGAEYLIPNSEICSDFYNESAWTRQTFKHSTTYYNMKKEIYICPEALLSNDTTNKRFMFENEDRSFKIIQIQGFFTESSRLLSYLFWPKIQLKNLTSDFVNAGFFYTSQSDWVQCYMCGVRICDWRTHHKPLVEHARHQPLCPLVINVPLDNVNVKCVTRTVETKFIEREQEERFQMRLRAGLS